MRNISAFGIYPDEVTVADAVEALKAAGFRSTDISVLRPDNFGSKDFGHERHTKAPEGAVAGGSVGALLGGAVGWLAGAGALFLPGLEQFTAAGTIVATLGGIGAGVSVGGLAGALVGAGKPEYEAKRYEGRIRKGGLLVSVHCDDTQWAKKARKVLLTTGARDVSATGEARADFARSERPIPRAKISA